MTNMKAKRAITATRNYTQGARAEATEATGQRIVDAFLARLMTEWYDEITHARVAEDAGVTVQTIVRRFGGKEGLLADAVKILAAQINARRAMPSGSIEDLVDNVVADYEKTGDAVIRLLALEPRHPALKQFLDVGRSEHRRWVAAIFATQLKALDARARNRALDALYLATDVYAWKLLRRDMGHGAASVARTMKKMVSAVLAEFVSNHKEN